jgi:hypothetical protein
MVRHLFIYRARCVTCFGAPVHESRVRHFWTFGLTSGASVYQSWVRHFSDGGIHLGCVGLLVQGCVTYSIHIGCVSFGWMMRISIRYNISKCARGFAAQQLHTRLLQEFRRASRRAGPRADIASMVSYVAIRIHARAVVAAAARARARLGTYHIGRFYK